MGKNKSASNLVNVIDVNNDRIAFISGSTTLMSISSSGAITTTGVISGSNAASASYALNAGLLNNKNSAEFTSTGSFNSYTSSNDSTVTGVAMSAATALAAIATLASKTGSYTTTSSFNSYTSSNDVTVNCVSSTATSAIVGVGALASKTGSYATTGSNVFDGGQYLSSSFNPTGFSTTASLYTDGGLRVSKDAYISGTLYLNNVTVYGTQSVCYITSSQLNIASNLITVNTATPSVQFGGLAVYDSGSTGLTGSILWDSQNNHWIYSNPSGSSYSGGMLISGPRTSTLGSETGTTSCMLLAGQGGDHLTSSMIYHSSTATCIPNTLIGSTICTTMTNASCISIGTQTPKSYSSLTSAGQIISLNNIGIDTGQSFRINNYYNSGTGTDRTISNGYAVSIGLDNSNGSITFNTSATCVAADNNITVTERMRITSAGIACFACQVYIGTSLLCWTDTVFKTLQVGNGAINNTTNQTQIVNNIYYDNSNYRSLIAGAANRLIMTTAGDILFEYAYAAGAGCALTLSPKMFICGSSGHVGIGTSTPKYSAYGAGSTTLTIQAASGDNIGILELGGTRDIGGNQNGMIMFYNKFGTTYETARIVGSNTASSNAAGELQFLTAASAGSIVERMRISSTGNVGIGNTNPSYKLDVCGNSSETTLKLKNSSATGISRIVLNPEGAGAGSSGDGLIFFDMNSTAWAAGVDKSDSSKFKIANDVYSDFSTNNYFTITTGGNVGINTSTPSQKLHIRSGGFLQTDGNSSWYRNVFERNGSSWGSVVGFTPGSSPQYTYGYINITASAYANGTSAGGVVTSRWYYSITNNSISVSVVGTDISTGSQAPAVRLIVSSGTIYVQVQSSNGVVDAYTTVFVDAMLASGYVNGTYWLIS